MELESGSTGTHRFWPHPKHPGGDPSDPPREDDADAAPVAPAGSPPLDIPSETYPGTLSLVDHAVISDPGPDISDDQVSESRPERDAMQPAPAPSHPESSAGPSPSDMPVQANPGEPGFGRTDLVVQATF